MAILKGTQYQFDHAHQSKRVTVQEPLGSGVFSTVYRVTDERNHEYALKVINFNSKGLTPEDRSHLMALIKRETSILKKLNMLDGFNKTENQAMMLMPYVKGPTVLQDLLNKQSASIHHPKDTEEKMKQCFQALLQVHRKGVVHLDAHLSNFIQPSSQEPQLIDFGLAQTKKRLNTFSDFYKFKFYDDRDSVRFRGYKATPWSTLLDWYIEESISYAKQNKIEFACKMLAYGTLTIASIYGLAYSATFQVMLWGLCQTFALDLVLENATIELETNQANLYIEKLSFLQNKLPFFMVQGSEKWEQAIKVGHVVSSALLFWSLYRSYQSPLKLIQELSSLFTENSPASLAFWEQASQAISTLDVVEALSFAYFPLTSAYQYLTDTFDYHFSSEESLAAQCENIASDKGLFHAFGAKQKDQEKAFQPENLRPNAPSV